MRRMRKQEGLTLLEVIMALGILAIIGLGFMSALSTSTRATGALDELIQAEALARSQLEDIKVAPYNTDSGCYSPDDCYDGVKISTPPDFSLDIKTEQLDLIDNALQKVTVIVSRISSGKPVLSLATYKKAP